MKIRFALLSISLGMVLPINAFASDPSACVLASRLHNSIDLISENIANINTTRTPEGGPYKYQQLICGAASCEVQSAARVKFEYNPNSFDAQDDGYVAAPDIDLLQEMDSIIAATRDWEAANAACLSRSELR